MSDIPRDPTDERDERLAARLETAPLDDVTRTRLVRAAMAASEPDSAGRQDGSRRSPARWLAVAAVIVLVLAVGFAVLARDDSDSEPTAARAERTIPSLQLGTGSTPPVAAGGLQEREFSTTLSGGGLGDLGEVGTNLQLRRAVRAAEAAASAGASKSTDESARAATPSPEYRAANCSPSLPGTTVAVGTGTADGEPVTVYVVKRKDGSRAAVVVRADCDVGEPVPL